MYLEIQIQGSFAALRMKAFLCFSAACQVRGFTPPATGLRNFANDEKRRFKRTQTQRQALQIPSPQDSARLAVDRKVVENILHKVMSIPLPGKTGTRQAHGHVECGCDRLDALRNPGSLAAE